MLTCSIQSKPFPFNQSENSLDPDQVALLEATLSGSAVLSKKVQSYLAGK